MQAKRAKGPENTGPSVHQLHEVKPTPWTKGEDPPPTKRRMGPIWLAAVAAALAGAAATGGPQPLSDRLLEWSGLIPLQAERVMLVTMERGATRDDWVDALANLDAAGAAAVGMINAPQGFAPDAVHFDLDGGIQQDAGLTPDWDGLNRSWDPGDAELSMPARLMVTAGQSVPDHPVRLPLANETVPMVAASQLAHVPPGVLDGRAAIVSSLSPWETPMVKTSEGLTALPVVIARAVGAPGIRSATIPWGLFAGFIIGLAGVMVVFGERSRARWGALAGLTAALLTFPLLVGVTLPIEVVAASGITGLLVRTALAWRSHLSRFEALVNRALWHLNLDTAPPDDATPWEALCRSSVELGAAERCWAMQREDGTWIVKAMAGLRGEEEGELYYPPEFEEPLVIHFQGHKGQPATLLMESTPWAGERELVAMQEVAQHLGMKLREEGEHDMPATRVEAGVEQVEKALNVLLEERTLHTAAAGSSTVARALFSPAGVTIRMDPRIKDMLPSHVQHRDLVTVWETLGGNRPDVVDILSGHGPFTVNFGDGQIVLFGCRDDTRLVGIAIEAVEPTTGMESGTSRFRHS